MSRRWQFVARRDAGQEFAAGLPALAPATAVLIARRKALYFHELRPPDLKGKTIVVVDDGVATGATLRASLLVLKGCGAARTLLVLPTAPPVVLVSLRGFVDETICLYQPTPFGVVGNAYQSFRQTSDQDIMGALQRCAGFLSAQECA